jgi:hypothetical protein
MWGSIFIYIYIDAIELRNNCLFSFPFPKQFVITNGVIPVHKVGT